MSLISLSRKLTNSPSGGSSGSLEYKPAQLRNQEYPHLSHQETQFLDTQNQPVLQMQKSVRVGSLLQEEELLTNEIEKEADEKLSILRAGMQVLNSCSFSVSFVMFGG